MTGMAVNMELRELHIVLMTIGKSLISYYAHHVIASMAKHVWIDDLAANSLVSSRLMIWPGS
jgi:hypothetical protein